MYQDFPYPEKIPGVKVWKNPNNKFNVVAVHYTSDPDKDPNRQGEKWYKDEKEQTLKSVWLKEYEIDFTTKSGKLIFGNDFCDFDSRIHFINSFEHGEPYERLISLDFGQRHPTCALIGIWTMDNELYIVDEYYKPALPSVSSREMFKEFKSYIGETEGKSLREKRIMAQNSFGIRVIDPSTKSKNRTKTRDGEEIPYSVIEEFWDHGWDFEPASNDVAAGITRIREYLQLDENNKSHLYVFRDKCPYLCHEIQHYRYQELSEIQEKTRNDSEEPVKKNDHAVDALRYMIMTRPITPMAATKPLTRIQKDIQGLLKPKIIANDWDDDSKFIN